MSEATERIQVDLSANERLRFATTVCLNGDLHDLLARLAAAERERAAADALAEAWGRFTECPDHAQSLGWCAACVANVRAHAAMNAALTAYRSARSER
jgi:hypothetical protein